MMFLRSAWFLSVILFVSLLPASAAQAEKDVLVLLRGTAEHPFNQQLLQGLYSASTKLPAPYHLEVQYTGNRFTSDYSPAWERYYEALEGLRGERHWDAVVVTWPADLKFALQYYPETLIINSSSGRDDESANLINLGQEFELRIRETLGWFRASYPAIDDLHLIVGSRPVESRAVNTILNVARGLGYASPDLLISRDPADLKSQLTKLPESAAVIYLPLLVDHRGEAVIARKLLQELSQVSNVPILSPLGSFVSAGAIGGYVGIVERYGSEIIRALQSSDSVATIDPPLLASGWIFNQQQLERYGLALPDLSDPRFSDARMINQPPPLFSTQGWTVLVSLGLSGLLLLLLSAFWSRKQRKIRKTVERLNQQLESTNLGLEETNSKLESALYQVSLEELKASTRTAQLQLAMRLASVTVFEVDYKTLRARRPDEAIWRPLLQQIADGLEDRSKIEKIMHLNQAPYTYLDIECWEGERSDTAQRHNYRLTLSEKTVNEEGREVFFLIRQEISAELDAQQRFQVEALERQNYQVQVARMAEHLARFESENRKLSEIAKQADLDGLTGCLNREGWGRLAEQEFARLKRQSGQTTTSLLMLDLDMFKQVNDTHGHLAGDTVLKEVVRLLQSQLRESDLLGRFGGEEFLILLPDTDEQEAEVFAERLRSTVRNIRHEKDIRVTVSIGLSQHQPELESLERWIELADGALYLAKAKGRDRVQIA